MRLLVTRDNYFETAMRLLATDGVSSIKISRLCGELKVSTGSFYGYFGSMEGFVAEFLTYWEETQTARIEALGSIPDEPMARIHTFKELVGRLPHDAEGAIRGWAHTNDLVAQAQKRVDDRRQRALVSVIAPVVDSRATARKLAIVGMTLLVGLQQWRSPVTRRDYNLVFNEYEKVLLQYVAGS